MNRCKKIVILVCVFLTALNIVACGQEKEDEADKNESEETSSKEYNKEETVPSHKKTKKKK